MTDGPIASLRMLYDLENGPLAVQHRLPAVRAHLFELDGDLDAARENYRLAAQRTTSTPERHYLLARADAFPPNGRLPRGTCSRGQRRLCPCPLWRHPNRIGPLGAK